MNKNIDNLYAFCLRKLEKQFELQKNSSSILQECRGGLTTFLTMAYIIIVNPMILGKTGLDPHNVFWATCLSAAIGCLCVAWSSNYPIGIAPGMALNAFFAYHLVAQNGLTPETGLALICISNLMLVLLCLTPLKNAIIPAIPPALGFAVSSGIGLFISLIALKEMKLLVLTHSGFFELGALNNPALLIALFGFVLIVTLEQRKIPGAILISILSSTVLHFMFVRAPTVAVSSLAPTLTHTLPRFLNLSFHAIDFSFNQMSLMLTFLLVVLFDSAGTLIAIVQHHPEIKLENKNQKTAHALLANAVTSLIGSLLGTTPTSPYIESAAGIQAGGRTGLTACVTGICFLLALLVGSWISLIPMAATAPAILYVGCLMLGHVTQIDWGKPTDAIPAALTLMLIPFTYSIADGIGIGFISYTLFHLFAGKPVQKTTWMLAGIFALYFISRSTN
jgi:AGZA family xanthine/uracil permease-like MFS transporter